MKKIVALVLALIMVLGMASVAFAANEVVLDKGAVKVEFIPNENAFKDVAANTIVGSVKFSADAVTYYVDADTDDVQDANEVTLTDDFAFTSVQIKDNKGNDYVWAGTFNQTAGTYEIKAAAAVAVAPSQYFIIYKATTPITAQNVAETVIVDKPADPAAPAQQFVQDAVAAAKAKHLGTVVIDLKGEGTEIINAASWEYLTNSYAAGWSVDWDALNKNIVVINEKNTYFYIDAAELDLDFAEDVNFGESAAPLAGYKKLDGTLYTEAELYKAIRKCTGDTKQPYVFGFKDGDAVVMNMTISKIIDQGWINGYGHKNLVLSTFAPFAEKCSECGLKHDVATIKLADAVITTEAATQTQRIEFETNTLYRTLVLSKAAAAAPADVAIDANPNTGANDMVNVAIVFAVISLVAAGAFVFSKQN